MKPCPKGERLRWHLVKSGTYRTYRCESLRCPICARAASDRLAAKIGTWAADRRLSRFWTFTLDPRRIPGVRYSDDAPLTDPEVRVAVAYLRKLWNKYLTAWRRDAPDLEYIAVLELQDSGSPHLHVLVNGWYPWQRMAARWRRMGGGSHVRVNGVRGGAEGVARYLAKYMGKSLPADDADPAADMLNPVRTYDAWPARTRHHTSSHGIHLSVTATQWNAASEGLWRGCFPRLLNVRDANELCRGCIYRRIRLRPPPRAVNREPGEDIYSRSGANACPGLCERAELIGPNGPVNRRRKPLPSRLIVFDASPEWVAVNALERYTFGTPQRLIPGRFRDVPEPDFNPAERWNWDETSLAGSGAAGQAQQVLASAGGDKPEGV